MKVAIDAGHGDIKYTAGKRTPDQYAEHWINVKVAYYCEMYLKQNGIDTIRVGWDDLNGTNDYDVSLSSRQNQIKSANCDYSISCHANAYANGWSNANGVETLIHNNPSYQNDSLKLAQCIQNRLIQGTHQSNRGVKQQSLAMCNCKALGTKASVLIEIGFMTNKAEAELMKTDAFCKEQGEDAAKGFLDYISSTKTNNEKNLKIASDIKSIQGWLNSNYKLNLIVDGIFGKKTKEGIAKAFQIELNLKGASLSVDGDFGVKSQNAYDKYVGVLRNGSKGIFVTLWQLLLYCYKYNPNGIDGIMGNNTVKATNEFLKSNHLSEDSSVSGTDINVIL